MMTASRILPQTSLQAASIALAALVAVAHVGDAQVAVLGNTLEERTAVPGEMYSSSIQIKNETTQPQRVRIYQTDYLFFADGRSSFADPNTTPRSNAKWVTPTVSSLVVPAASEVTVAYTVQVPATDSLVGTYWSTIMIEGDPAVSPSNDRTKVSVGAVLRYAVQVATHINGTGSRTIGFSNTQVVANPDSTKALELDVANNGQRGYHPVLWVEIYDAQGALKAAARQERGLLYPGTSLKQQFQFGKLASGAYKAIVFADSGDDTVFATQYSIRY